MGKEGDDMAFAATEAASAGKDGPTLASGDRLAGAYTVDKLLGQGTFGWVFSAHHDDGRRAAIKVLRPQHAADDAIVLRFKRRELELLRRVHAAGAQPNVVQAVETDLIEHLGSMVLVLELVDGPALDEVIARERMLEVGEARTIAAGIARGLHAIHAVDGVHRDLKPANVRLRRNGEPVILDLGIARAMWETQTLTGTGQYLMTPLYASPEQLTGGEVGPPSDVYALGLILYEMLTGTVPLTGRNYVETLTARTTRNPPDPRTFGRVLEERVVALTLGCLQRDADRRPRALDLAEALAAPGGRARRRSPFVLVGGIGAGMAVVATALGLSLRTPSPPLAPKSAADSPAVSAAAPVEAGRGSYGLAISAPARVRHGSSVRVTLAVDRAAWVLLATMDAKSAVSVLTPRAVPLRAGDRVILPDSVAELRGERFRVVLPRGSQRATEAFVAIAAADEKTLARVLTKLKALGPGARDLTGRLEELDEVLAEPTAEIAAHPYEIIRGGDGK
jgi:serine/threonine-protein kinase